MTICGHETLMAPDEGGLQHAVSTQALAHALAHVTALRALVRSSTPRGAHVSHVLAEHNLRVLGYERTILCFSIASMCS